MKRILLCIFTIFIIDTAYAHTVTYDCGTSNGTAPSDSTNYNSDDVVTVKPNTCNVPSGKHFSGYVCGSTNIASGNNFTITANTTCIAQYKDGKFAVTTINLSANDTLQFSMTATGTFTVDCGDGGVLSSSADPTDVSGNTITRTTTDTTTYTCTWGSAGAHTIGFDGTGTGYNADGYIPSFAFYTGVDDTASAANAAKITSISGNLLSVFPKIGTSYSKSPWFQYTFRGTSVTSIPNTLFSGYINDGGGMFYGTFMGCTGLTSIPHDLFANLTKGNNYTFRDTFRECSSLQSIPHDLFSTITTSGFGLFWQTFYGCTSLQSIPHDLFSTISGNHSYLFAGTFAGCTGLTSIPHDLFSTITKSGYAMFSETFKDCTSLTSIPENLFFPNAQSVDGQTALFNNTFMNCTSLTSIPAGLFAKVTTPATDMFVRTFYNCSSLGCSTVGCSTGTGYIPPSTFAGLIANDSTKTTNMWTFPFYNTKLVQTCPTGTTQYITGYEGTTWNGKVSCSVNNISLTWQDDNGNAIDSGTCSYGEAISLPTTPTKTGYTFAGWQVVSH